MSQLDLEQTKQDLRDISEQILDLSKKHGATTAELSLNRGTGLSVEIHMDVVDKLEYHRDQGLNLTVYMGQQS